MNLLNSLLPQGGDSREIEKSNFINISKNTIKFGDSVYQFINVTGFGIGEIKKGDFPWLGVFILVVLGIATLAFAGIGLIFLGLAGFAIYGHFIVPQSYGLSLYLNSGQEKFFTSTDKRFLGEVVATLYQFMEEDRLGSVSIDLSNRSIQVGGNLYGNANLGDRSMVN